MGTVAKTPRAGVAVTKENRKCKGTWRGKWTWVGGLVFVLTSEAPWRVCTDVSDPGQRSICRMQARERTVAKAMSLECGGGGLNQGCGPICQNGREGEKARAHWGRAAVGAGDLGKFSDCFHGLCEMGNKSSGKRQGREEVLEVHGGRRIYKKPHQMSWKANG